MISNIRNHLVCAEIWKYRKVSGKNSCTCTNSPSGTDGTAITVWKYKVGKWLNIFQFMISKIICKN